MTGKRKCKINPREEEELRDLKSTPGDILGRERRRESQPTWSS